MTRSWADIYVTMQQRREHDSVLFRQMINVRDRSNGDVVIPLPDVDGEPTMTPPTPRLIADAIDSQAMRAASVQPGIFCPPLDATKTQGPGSVEFASIRRRALLAKWHESAVDVLDFRAYRHLTGYGTCDWIVVPDFDARCARVELRDPLTAYPELRTPDDVREPLNVGFVFGRSKEFIRKVYGQAGDTSDTANNLRKWLGNDSSDTLWDVVEWIDQDDIVIGLLGPRSQYSGGSIDQSTYTGYQREYSNGMELRRWPNRAGMVPVATPRRITLDRVFGQVANVLGTSDLLDRFMALDYIAAEKGVFPDMAVVGQGGRIPSLVGGEWKDGRTGEVNLILDGQPVVLQSSPGPLTSQTIGTLERAVRMSSGNPGMNGGELTGSLRSGQTISSLAGISIDPRVQESHVLMQRAKTVVNEAIMAVESGYWPRRKYTVFSGMPGDALVEYTPADHFEKTPEGRYLNAVTYPYPGMDVSQVTVAVAQLSGAGLLSKKSGRVVHPFIKNPEQEEREVILERMDEAQLTSLLQQAVAGTLPAIDFARIRQLFASGKSIEEAVIKAHDEAQKRQAKLAPPPGDGQATDPTAQPGLSAPGQGVEAPQPADQNALPSIMPPSSSQMNLKQLLGAIKAH